MDDKELLGIARKYEGFLVRMESGEIDEMLNSSIQAIYKSSCIPTAVSAAQICAMMKRFVFRNDVMLDLLKIEKAQNEAEKAVRKEKKHG